MECDLPLVNPSKDENADFSHGANFAVSGATALSVEYLTRKKIAMSYTNSSLSVQLDWMTAHFKSICYPGKIIREFIHQVCKFCIDYFHAFVRLP